MRLVESSSFTERGLAGAANQALAMFVPSWANWIVLAELHLLLAIERLILSQSQIPGRFPSVVGLPARLAEATPHRLLLMPCLLWFRAPAQQHFEQLQSLARSHSRRLLGLVL